MNFEVNSALTYQVSGPTTFIFNIHALRTKSQTVLEEKLSILPDIRVEEFNSHDYESRFMRLRIEEPMDFSISYTAKVDMRFQLLDEKNSAQTVPVVELNSYIATFLYPSKYCQSDKLMKFSFKQFGHHNSVYDKVSAIVEWVYVNIEYTIGSSDSRTSAMDTIIERVGVCRDFAHLSIALCRALSIPARYFTGYAYQLKPQDFHACFEAYIDGSWIIFDATKLAPLNGLIKIASGRDAADSAVASIFGLARSTSMNVTCEVMNDDFEAIKYNGEYKGISFQ